MRTWDIHSKKENCPHHKGIFGHVTAVFGGNETQARGALHVHLLIFGGIAPKLLQSAAYVEAACIRVEAALDKMYVAELPQHLHVQDMLTQDLQTQESSMLLE